MKRLSLIVRLMSAAVAGAWLIAGLRIVAAEEKPVAVERVVPVERSGGGVVGGGTITPLRVIGSNGPGRLIDVDYIHRSGRYYRADFRDVIAFHLPPEGFVLSSNTEADLRDVPIGARCMFEVRGAIEPRESEVVRVHVPSDERLTDAELQRAYEKQFAKFTASSKGGGLPARITASDANTVTLEFFSGEPEYFRWRWLKEFAVGKEVRVCAADEELRTWNASVDAKKGTITKVEQAEKPAERLSGVRLTVKVSDTQESFRAGRIVRVFGPGWKVRDQVYGASPKDAAVGRPLPEVLQANPAKEHPERYPYRTDFGNANLPWYQLKPGVKPPAYSEHVVYGALIEATDTSGKLIDEETGDSLTFSLLGEATVNMLGKPAKLWNLREGSRCRFHLYQDEQGKFTRAALVSDEYSRLVANQETYRITALRPAAHEIEIARQLPEVEDDDGDLRRPPDLGAKLLFTSFETKVFREGKPAQITDLQVGDVIRINLAGTLPRKPAQISDIYVGDE